MRTYRWSSARWVEEVGVQKSASVGFYKFTHAWLEQFDAAVQQEFFRYVEAHFRERVAHPDYMEIRMSVADIIYLGRALWRADPASTYLQDASKLRQLSPGE